MLHGFGWSYEDYARGYILQDTADEEGRVLDKWTVASREEEGVILRQFLRFGETRSIAKDILAQLTEEGAEERKSRPRERSIQDASDETAKRAPPPPPPSSRPTSSDRAGRSATAVAAASPRSLANVAAHFPTAASIFNSLPNGTPAFLPTASVAQPPPISPIAAAAAVAAASRTSAAAAAAAVASHLTPGLTASLNLGARSSSPPPASSTSPSSSSTRSLFSISQPNGGAAVGGNALLKPPPLTPKIQFPFDYRRESIPPGEFCYLVFALVAFCSIGVSLTFFIFVFKRADDTLIIRCVHASL